MEERRDGGIFMRSSRGCPACMGRGFIAKTPCKSCKGTASREIAKDVALEVPQNVREGYIVGSMADGHIGLNGGPSGDLVVKLYMALPKAEELNDDQRRALEGLYE